MNVRLFPNGLRPGVGRKPRREEARAVLPDFSPRSPVTEAGSALGYLVYPALHPNESFHVEYQGDGRFRFAYFMRGGDGQWRGVFALTMTLPMGTVGMMNFDVSFMVDPPPISREEAVKFSRALIVPEDFGTPPGAVALRAATNFQTPEGWDTVYVPVFRTERPVAPMLAVRVETDWYAHWSEFRYVLQPGEGIPGSHDTPIGQVFFVPRDEIAMRDPTPEESSAFRESLESFGRRKRDVKPGSSKPQDGDGDSTARRKKSRRRRKEGKRR